MVALVFFLFCHPPVIFFVDGWWCIFFLEEAFGGWLFGWGTEEGGGSGWGHAGGI
jgi:hypothetical protein